MSGKTNFKVEVTPSEELVDMVDRLEKVADQHERLHKLLGGDGDVGGLLPLLDELDRRKGLMDQISKLDPLYRDSPEARLAKAVDAFRERIVHGNGFIAYVETGAGTYRVEARPVSPGPAPD